MSPCPFPEQWRSFGGALISKTRGKGKDEKPRGKNSLLGNILNNSVGLGPRSGLERCLLGLDTQQPSEKTEGPKERGEGKCLSRSQALPDRARAPQPSLQALVEGAIGG